MLLARLVMLLVLGAPAFAPAAAQPGTTRPNVLLVIVDQEAPALRLPPLERPNLERIAARGVSFTRAYAAYPVCSPSRAALLTGLYPHQNGVIENVMAEADSPPLDASIPNLGSVFKGAGFTTAWFGKWHLSPDDAVASYGFEHMFEFPRGKQGKDGDPIVVEAAATWIRARPQNEPWLAVVSLLGPHDIARPELYEDVEVEPYPVELPPSFDDDPTASSRAPELRAHASARRENHTPSDQEEWIRYLRLYCYQLELVDRRVGVVLEALDSRADAARTLVVYTSDHGEMGGAHGMAQKRFLYEESVRIALTIVHPGVAPASKSDRLVSNVDLAPTLAALAKVEWPTVLPGRDLFAAKNGVAASAPGSAEEDAVFAEVSIPSTRVRAERAEKLTRMVRTRDWKYVLYPSGAEELYDTAADPFEVKNLAVLPEQAARRAGLRDRLTAWLAATPATRADG